MIFSRDLQESNACSIRCLVRFSNVSFCLNVDINECEAETADCDDNAECINTEGSYDCTCKSGFTGNRTTCIGWYTVSGTALIRGQNPMLFLLVT